MTYSKPWLSVAEQINLLMSRGLLITDKARAASCLEKVGYYRLSGYLYAFRERTGICCPYPRVGNGKKTTKLVLDSYRPGATFQDCLALYIFDKKLRLLALDALERVEIALRVDISHLLGELDPFAYQNVANFHPTFSVNVDGNTGVTAHHQWLQKQATLIVRSREDFVLHNKAKNGLPLPIWIACEVWDFGALATLYGGMRESDQDQISAAYGVSNGRVFASWLKSLNYLRNVCAHHCRLWNRNFDQQPKLPSSDEMKWVTPFVEDDHARARCFAPLVILSHLVRSVSPNSTWPARLKEHMHSFPQLDHIGLNLYGMGAAAGWDELLNDLLS